MGDDSKSDNTLILDRINRLETRIDNNISRLEEKNDSNYTRLEEKLDSNNTRLEEKLNEWISKFDDSFATLKDEVNDHEYRIKNIENSRKDQNDKIFNMLAKATDSGSFTIPNKKEEAALRQPQQILKEIKTLDKETEKILHSILEMI